SAIIAGICSAPICRAGAASGSAGGTACSLRSAAVIVVAPIPPDFQPGIRVQLERVEARPDPRSSGPRRTIRGCREQGALRALRILRGGCGSLPPPHDEGPQVFSSMAAVFSGAGLEGPVFRDSLHPGG